MSKLTEFIFEGQKLSVKFVETMTVKEGVECDVYTFVDDGTKDLAIVHVKQGFKTPLQRILRGDKTVEGYVDGKATLTIADANGEPQIYQFGPGQVNQPVTVTVGQLMQWSAEDEGLTFYEVCQPPYEEGRFENIPD